MLEALPSLGVILARPKIWCYEMNQEHRHLKEDLDALEAVKAMRHVLSQCDALARPELFLSHILILDFFKEAQQAFT